MLVITVPVELPKSIGFHQLPMTIVENHIDGARKRLPAQAGSLRRRLDQTVEKPPPRFYGSLHLQLNLLGAVGWGAVHELVEICPGALGLAQVQTRGDLFD